MSSKQYLGDAPADYNNKYFEDQISAGVSGFSLSWSSIQASPKFVYDATLRLMPVFSWTINDEQSMAAAIAAGVSGIITDEVSMAYHVVSSYCSDYYYAN